MTIVFAGTPDFAAAILNALLDANITIAAVFTQPDRKAGRGQQLQASPVKQLALQHKLPIHQPLSLKDPAAQQVLQDLKPNLMIVAAYGLLLPQTVLDIPRLGCINVHASLLPRWRGAAPIQQAILAGDKVTGITLMQMEAGLDTGPMLAKAECEITSTETTTTLHDKLAAIGAQLLVEKLPGILANELKAEVQDDTQATHAGKIKKADAKIDWQQPAAQIDRQIRAFNPWPVAFSELAGQRIRLWETSLTPGATPGTTPGTILAVSTDGITVTTGEGCLNIQQLQLPGKTVQTAEQILAGHADLFKPGHRFS